MESADFRAAWHLRLLLCLLNFPLGLLKGNQSDSLVLHDGETQTDNYKKDDGSGEGSNAYELKGMFEFTEREALYRMASCKQSWTVGEQAHQEVMELKMKAQRHSQGDPSGRSGNQTGCFFLHI